MLKLIKFRCNRTILLLKIDPITIVLAPECLLYFILRSVLVIKNYYHLYSVCCATTKITAVIQLLGKCRQQCIQCTIKQLILLTVLKKTTAIQSKTRS